MSSYAREYARIPSYRRSRCKLVSLALPSFPRNSHSFYRTQGKKNVEVRPAHTNKGEIVKRLLYQYPEAEFCMCAGDDKTDEDMVSYPPSS